MNLENTEIKKVRQSNYLIESPYTQEFTAHEIKLFEIALSAVTIDTMESFVQKSNKRYCLTSSQLAYLLNTSVSTISHEIENTAKRVMKKTIHLRKILPNDELEFEMINIIPFAKYKNGIFEYDLNYAVIPYLIGINKNFTEYQLNHLLSMRSAYAIKLYKLLCQYKILKSRVFNVNELKEQFGISDKYKQYNDFKKKIIIPSIEQINQLTDLEVSYIEIKYGRKIDKIKFEIEVKKKTENDKKEIEINKSDEDLTKLVDSIKDKISENTILCLKTYYEEKGISYIQASVEYALANSNKNFDKYLQDTLINNWGLLVLNQIENRRLQKQKKQEEIAREKEQQIRQEEDRNREHLNKNNIEHEFYKLPDISKEPYEKYANNLLIKHEKKLSDLMRNNIDKLVFSVYAVSNNKCYDKLVEMYCDNILYAKLSIYKQ